MCVCDVHERVNVYKLTAQGRSSQISLTDVSLDSVLLNATLYQLNIVLFQAGRSRHTLEIKMKIRDYITIKFFHKDIRQQIPLF